MGRRSRISPTPKGYGRRSVRFDHHLRASRREICPFPAASRASNRRVASVIVSPGRFGVMDRGRGALLGSSGLLAARSRTGGATRTSGSRPGVAARTPRRAPRPAGRGRPRCCGGRARLPGLPAAGPYRSPTPAGHRRRQVTDAGRSPTLARTSFPGASGRRSWPGPRPTGGGTRTHGAGRGSRFPGGAGPPAPAPRTRGEGWRWRAPGAVRRRDCLSGRRDSR